MSPRIVVRGGGTLQEEECRGMQGEQGAVSVCVLQEKGNKYRQWLLQCQEMCSNDFKLSSDI